MLAPDVPTPDAMSAESIPPASGQYERTEINIKGVLLFFGVVGVSLAVLQFGVWELLQLFQTDAVSHKSPQSPRAPSSVTPPEPRLKDQPLVEYLRFEEEQNTRLNSYGWIDRRQRVVHIPIARAMDILEVRGLSRIVEPRANPEKNVTAPQKLKPSTK